MPFPRDAQRSTLLSTFIGVLSPMLLIAGCVGGSSFRPIVHLDAGTCAAGQTVCTGVCVDLSIDDANCGACGTACGDGTGCAAGSAPPPPPAPAAKPAATAPAPIPGSTATTAAAAGPSA